MQGHPRSAKDTMGTMAAMTKTTNDSFGGNTTTAVPHIIVGANGKAAVRYVRGALLQLEMVMAFIFSFTRHLFPFTLALSVEMLMTATCLIIVTRLPGAFRGNANVTHNS